MKKDVVDDFVLFYQLLEWLDNFVNINILIGN